MIPKATELRHTKKAFDRELCGVNVDIRDSRTANVSLSNTLLHGSIILEDCDTSISTHQIHTLRIHYLRWDTYYRGDALSQLGKKTAQSDFIHK